MAEARVETPYRIDFVRSGRAALDWLARTVDELKGGDPLRPVMVVMPNFYAGRLARALIAAGQPDSAAMG